jgi:hypothetical protein
VGALSGAGKPRQARLARRPGRLHKESMARIVLLAVSMTIAAPAAAAETPVAGR